MKKVYSIVSIIIWQLLSFFQEKKKDIKELVVKNMRSAAKQYKYRQALLPIDRIDNQNCIKLKISNEARHRRRFHT